MEEDNSKVTKATLWYTVSNILLRGVSLFTAPIFTRLLSTADYGIASNFTSWCSIVLCFTSLSLGTAALRGKMEYKEKYKEFLSAIQALGMIWCMICCVVIIVMLDFWSGLMNMDTICIVIMLCYLLLFPSLTYAQIDLRFDYKYRENVAISILNTMGTVMVSIGLILFWSERRYLGRIIGTVLPAMIIGLWFAGRIFAKGKKIYALDYWKYALKLSLPMIPHSLAMIVLGQIDRVMIMKYFGESDAGIYSFGYSYGVLLSVVTNAVGDAVQPWMYSMLENKQEKEMAGFSYKLMLLGVLLSIIIIGVGPEALRVLGTEAYFDARWAIAPIVLGTMMQYMYQFYGVVEIYSKKTGYMAVGSCMAAIANYGLNWWFIPRFGWIAAAYTTFASYGLLMIFHFFMARVTYRKVVYRSLPVLLILILLIGAGVILNIMYRWNVIARYLVLILISATMGYGLRNEIKMIAGRVLKR